MLLPIIAAIMGYCFALFYGTLFMQTYENMFTKKYGQPKLFFTLMFWARYGLLAGFFWLAYQHDMSTLIGSIVGCALGFGMFMQYVKKGSL